MSSITLRQLKIFASIVEQGSFAKSAKQLDVSPVAVSEHIKKLETHLGHQLFKRSPGGVAILSKEGERDYQRISRILFELDALHDNYTQANSAKDQRKLNIALAPFILYCIQKSVSKFEALHPEVELSFELDAISYTEIESQFSDNEVDIGYFYALENHECPESDFICYEPLALYVGENHPLAKQDSVQVSDLISTAFVQTSKKNYLSKLFEQAMKEIGLTGSPVALQTDNMALYFSSLQRNVGFTCMCQSAESTEYTTKLKRLPLECALSRLQVRQVIKPALRNDQFIREAALQLTSSIRRS